MSRSDEKRIGQKRLTDKERARDMATLDSYIPQHAPPQEARERLVADYRQTLEDRETLVTSLREWLVEMRAHLLSLSPAATDAQRAAVAEVERRLARDTALLSEVGR